MNKKFLFIAMLSIAVFSVFVSCDKKDKEEVVDDVTIYGTVVDATNGNPIENAQIAVYKDIEEEPENTGDLGALGSSVTGSDGSFEFTISNLDRKCSYLVLASKTGYEEGYLELSLSSLKTGGKRKCDFQLHKTASSFMVVDDHQKEISTIDFGANGGTDMRSITITNKSSRDLNWEIKYNAAWILSVSPSSGKIYQNESKSVIITIDRNSLAEGNNSTLIHVSTNLGNREITVTAQNGFSGYFIKHPWGGGEWSWVKMSKESKEGDYYVYTGQWGGEGANINTVSDDTGADWFPAASIDGSNYMYVKDKCKFIYYPVQKTLKVEPIY